MRAPRIVILAVVLSSALALGATAAEASHQSPGEPCAPAAAASPSDDREEAGRGAGLIAPPALGPALSHQDAGGHPPIRNAKRATAPDAPDTHQTPEPALPAAEAAHRAASDTSGGKPSPADAAADHGPTAPCETVTEQEQPVDSAPEVAAEGTPAPAPDPAPAPAPDPAPPASSPRTLYIGGAAIPYRDVRGGTTPDAGAGLWLGSDDTADGSWGYFVGHNPGPFAPVKTLGCGSTITLCDTAGATRTYIVRDVFTIETTATWKTIAGRVTGYGESLVLQTCTGDGATNTIVVAA